MRLATMQITIHSLIKGSLSNEDYALIRSNLHKPLRVADIIFNDTHPCYFIVTPLPDHNVVLFVGSNKLVYDTDLQMELDVKCCACREYHVVTVPLTGYVAWQAGTFIKDAMPALSEDNRELLISNICPDCFDKLFSGDEE